MSGCGHLLCRPEEPCKRGIVPAPPPEPEQTVAPIRTDLLAMKAERCRRSLAWFVRDSWHVLEPGTPLIWGPHLQAVCDHVQWVLEDWIRTQTDTGFKQRAQNMVFSLPPGSAKTRLIMECAPAWMWTRWPSWRVICLSRNPKRALDSARNSRQIIKSAWYQTSFRPPWELRDDQDAASDFANNYGGSRYSKGIVAEIVGSRADALFVDDPNAPDDDQEAAQKINELWDSTLFSRVNDMRFCVRIIVQQRIATNDLTGHVTGRDGWTSFVMPLEFDPSRRCVTPFGWTDWRTHAGESFHPERYTPAVIEELRQILGPRGYEAQANQNPSAGEGDAFKIAWWNWFVRADREVPEKWKRPEGSRSTPAFELQLNRDGSLMVDWVCISVDATFGSLEATASAVGLLVVAGDNKGRRFVLDDRTPGPRSFLDTIEDIRKAVIASVRCTGKRSVKILVEKKANGAAIIEQISKSLKSGDLGDVDGRPVVVSVESYEPKSGSKEARAQAMEPDLARGDVYIPEGESWLTPFFAEFRRFPAKPNDRVDSLGQVLDRFRKKLGWAEALKAAGR